jgi:hypothetical protein
VAKKVIVNSSIGLLTAGRAIRTANGAAKRRLERGVRRNFGVRPRKEREGEREGERESVGAERWFSRVLFSFERDPVSGGPAFEKSDFFSLSDCKKMVCTFDPARCGGHLIESLKQNLR